MLWRRMSLALALVFGGVASQAPEFAQAYFQRLGGAIDELNSEVKSFDADRRNAGLSHDEAVAHLRASGDDIAKGRGERIAQDQARLEHLREQQEAMNDGTPLAKVRATLAAPDATVARGAWRDFKPALPLTSDGAICAAGGFVGLLALLRALALPFRRKSALKDGRRAMP